MRFAKLENNKLTYAPINFTTDKGSLITNFPNYLTILHNGGYYDKTYGFKRIEDIPPTFNPDTHYLTIEGYTEEENKIIINYSIVEFKAPEVIESLEDKVKRLEDSNLELMATSWDLDFRVTELEIGGV